MSDHLTPEEQARLDEIQRMIRELIADSIIRLEPLKKERARLMLLERQRRFRAKG